MTTSLRLIGDYRCRHMTALGAFCTYCERVVELEPVEPTIEIAKSLVARPKKTSLQDAIGICADCGKRYVYGEKHRCVERTVREGQEDAADRVVSAVRSDLQSRPAPIPRESLQASLRPIRGRPGKFLDPSGNVIDLHNWRNTKWWSTVHVVRPGTYKLFEYVTGEHIPGSDHQASSIGETNLRDHPFPRNDLLVHRLVGQVFHLGETPPSDWALSAAMVRFSAHGSLELETPLDDWLRSDGAFMTPVPVPAYSSINVDVWAPPDTQLGDGYRLKVILEALEKPLVYR